MLGSMDGMGSKMLQFMGGYDNLSFTLGKVKLPFQAQGFYSSRQNELYKLSCMKSSGTFLTSEIFQQKSYRLLLILL